MYRRRMAWLVAALVCALGGCGTIGNLSDPNQTKPFGGVIRDANASSWLMSEASEALKKPAAEKAGLVLAVPILTMDLPLSLAADTVTLPITLPMAMMRRGQPETPPAPGPLAPPVPAPTAEAPADPTAVSNFVPCVPRAETIGP
jgi:uncharacterized protein YceK